MLQNKWLYISTFFLAGFFFLFLCIDIGEGFDRVCKLGLCLKDCLEGLPQPDKCETNVPKYFNNELSHGLINITLDFWTWFEL